MQDRNEYEVMFAMYPDVVSTKELRIMLGGICEKTALTMLRQNMIQHFRIGAVYQIPKVSVIDFMVSEGYIAFRKRIEYAKIKKTDDKVRKIQLKILMLCETPKTRKELMYLLDMESKKNFFRLYLHPLLESEELQMTIPNQPSVSTQKYVRAN